MGKQPLRLVMASEGTDGGPRMRATVAFAATAAALGAAVLSLLLQLAPGLHWYLRVPLDQDHSWQANCLRGGLASAGIGLLLSAPALRFGGRRNLLGFAAIIANAFLLWAGMMRH
jgi:hypothetical protein